MPNFEKLSPREAANFLGVTAQTLSVWRCLGRYDLPFVRVGSKIFYLKIDLEKFLMSRRVGELRGEDNE